MVKAAIAGIGATEFSKDSGRSELRLATEAVTAALADAGLSASSVRGLACYAMDNNDPSAVAGSLGLNELTFFVQTPGGGGGACGTVALATMAVTRGIADVVVCYRAMNERSGQRFGQQPVYGPGGMANSFQVSQSWLAPFGLGTPASQMAMSARRYMHQYGATSEDFGLIAVSDRAYAATNPKAWFYQRPITIEDHQNSRLISDPLHLLDCCQESDGAVALVVTTLERARDLRQPPIEILSAAQGLGPRWGSMALTEREDMAAAADTAVVGRQLWEQSGLRAADIDVANIYDHFAPSVLMVLEALGFCGPGEAPAFIREEGIGVTGRLPLNTNGGQLGEAYIHGYNGIAEVVRQLRGTAVNQVADARHGVVTSGSHVPTSGLVLGRA
jgi:acetyl-CoA acetyltransferase